jgi:hypothetical protein
MASTVQGELMSAQEQPIKLPVSAVMLRMIQGFWVSRAICVAAELGIADLLKMSE